jgi:succinoglycan biosynthesis transport protein ExoP
MPVSTGGDEVHLLDRFATVFRHRRLAISLFSGVVLLMMLQSYATIPMFRATAQLLIDEEQSVMVSGMDASDPVNYWTDSEPYYETQYRILQSPGLAGYTVGKLDLDQVPEFNGQAEKQFGPREALQATRAVVVSRVQTVGQAILGLIRPNSGTDRPTTHDEAPAEQLQAKELAQTNGVVSRLAVAPVVNTRLVDVSYTSADPAFAADAVNTHVETYVERNLASRLEAVQKTLAWVSGELATQQSGVEESDRSLSEYRESENALSLDANTDVITTRLATLNSQVSTARADRIQAESLYRQIQELDPANEAARNHPSVSGAAGVAAASTRLAGLEGQLVGLAGRYGPLHPDMIGVNSEIASAERAVAVEVGRAIEAVRSEYQSAADEERRLQAEFEAQQSRAEDLSRKAVDYRLLERQSASNQRVYESLLQQQNELQVVANSRANNVQSPTCHASMWCCGRLK